jgi:hypothetical protein
MTSIDTAVHSLPDAPDWSTLFGGNAASIFIRPAWLSAVRDAFGNDVRVAVARSGQDIVGIMPLHIKRKGGFTASVPFPLALYAGLTFDSTYMSSSHDEERSTIIKSMQAAIGSEIDTGVFSLSPALSEMRPFDGLSGWTCKQLHTYVIDLDRGADPSSSYSQSLRRKVRRARDAGLELVESRDAGTLIKQHVMSYGAHQRSAPYPSEPLRRFVERLLDLKLIRIFEARDSDGAVYAMRAFAVSEQTAFDWLAGRDTLLPDLHASHFLVAGALAMFRDEGCSSFDFMGANTEGVADFKRCFGGRLVPYGEAAWNRNQMMKFLMRISDFRHTLKRR